MLGFLNQFDTLKKIEIGFCIVVFGIAGYFFWTGLRSDKREMVAAYTVDVVLGKDGERASSTNPADPDKSYQITSFVNSDGKLWFKEFPRKNDPTLKAEVHFTPNPDKKTYSCFPTVLQTVQADGDPVRRAIMETTVTSFFRNSASFTAAPLLRELGIPSDPKLVKACDEKCTDLMNRLIVIDADVSRGSIDRKKYEKVLAALQEFRNSGPDDIAKNTKKQEAAKEVMTVGLEYVKIIQDKKVGTIQYFANEVIALLNDDQKKRITDRFAPKPAVPAATPPGNNNRPPNRTKAPTAVSPLL